MPAPRSLAELERDVAHDLDLIAHPRAPWLERKYCRGEPVLDVLLIGAGQSALAVAFALLRDKVTNILCIDRAEEGLEGPWLTYARMHTLRSWKDQTGPDLQVPSLTYQAWHEAQWGAEDFAAMRYIPKEKWAAYLMWFRRVTGIPVRNRVEAGEIVPDRTDDGLPCLAVSTSAGTIRARKVVLATGQEGVGSWWMPDFLARLPGHLRAHTADAIDFAALRGKVVAVLGAGASAFDNAATALEAGAREVHLFCRRAEPMVIQPWRVPLSLARERLRREGAGQDALDRGHPPVRHRHHDELRTGRLLDQCDEHRRAALGRRRDQGPVRRRPAQALSRAARLRRPTGGARSLSAGGGMTEIRQAGLRSAARQGALKPQGLALAAGATPKTGWTLSAGSSATSRAGDRSCLPSQAPRAIRGWEAGHPPPAAGRADDRPNRRCRGLARCARHVAAFLHRCHSRSRKAAIADDPLIRRRRARIGSMRGESRGSRRVVPQ